MKRVLAVAVLFLFLCASAQAMSSVNPRLIREAQEYGQRNAKQDTEEFLLPWTVYEESSLQISEKAERAYLYTPFLLVALNTKDNVQNGIKPGFEDSRRFLTNYKGFLTFEVILYGYSAEFSSNPVAWLQQGKKRTRHFQIAFSSKPSIIADLNSDRELYKAQCYIYFSDKGISPVKPVKLIVSLADKQERNFYFNLAKIR